MANKFFTHLLCEFGTQFVTAGPLRVNGNSTVCWIGRGLNVVSNELEMCYESWPWPRLDGNPWIKSQAWGL